MIKFTNAEPAKPKQAPKPGAEDAEKLAPMSREAGAGEGRKTAVSKRKKSEPA